MNNKLQVMIEGALTAGLAFALGYIPSGFGPGEAFDISFGMIPMAIFAIRRGLVPGLTAGLVWGLLKIVAGKMIVLTLSQWIFDYLLAFTFAGFLGIFSSQVLHAVRSKDTAAIFGWVSATTAIGVFARWFWHFLAGVLVWGQYAPPGQSKLMYSLVFNGGSFLTNMVLIIALMTVLARRAPVLFLYGVPNKDALKQDM